MNRGVLDKGDISMKIAKTVIQRLMQCSREEHKSSEESSDSRIPGS